MDESESEAEPAWLLKSRTHRRFVDAVCTAGVLDGCAGRTISLGTSTMYNNFTFPLDLSPIQFAHGWRVGYCMFEIATQRLAIASRDVFGSAASVSISLCQPIMSDRQYGKVTAMGVSKSKVLEPLIVSILSRMLSIPRLGSLSCFRGDAAR